MLTTKNFTGVMTPLLVPLDKNEQLIESELRNHISNLIKKGVHGFLSPSSTGEFANLPLETRDKILRVTVDETNGRLPVVALIGECGTRTTLRNIEFAREAGADAVMATPPYYYPLTQEALFDHFYNLAEEGGQEFWLYHQPNDTKMIIEHHTLLKLSKHPNIVGVKVSTTDMLYYHRVTRLFEKNSNFTVLMGEDHSYLPALSLGGNGVVSFLSNIVPDMVIDLWHSITKADFASARKAQKRLMNCFELFFTLEKNNPISACKLILKQKGIFTSERSSAPFPVLSEEDKAEVLHKASEMELIK